MFTILGDNHHRLQVPGFTAVVKKELGVSSTSRGCTYMGGC